MPKLRQPFRCPGLAWQEPPVSIPSAEIIGRYLTVGPVQRPGCGSMASVGEKVLSEVHVAGCPPGCSWWTTSFRVELPLDEVGESSDSDGEEGEGGVDDDGDLVLPRRHQTSHAASLVRISLRHFGATEVSSVGLQVWRGSLLLCDLALAMGGALKGKVCLELGSGTGLTAICVGRWAAAVYVTDTGPDVLENCAQNISANSAQMGTSAGKLKVRELDWRLSLPSSGLRDVSADLQAGAFAWSEDDLRDLAETEVIWAGDTIYDDNLTDSFASILSLLLRLPRRPVLYLAIEKRWIFTLRDMDTRAPAFDYFMGMMGLPLSQPPASETSSTAHTIGPTTYIVAAEGFPSSAPLRKGLGPEVLQATRMEINSIDKRLDYDRGADMELWRMQIVQE